jgi:hypothetical protein
MKNLKTKTLNVSIIFLFAALLFGSCKKDATLDSETKLNANKFATVPPDDGGGTIGGENPGGGGGGGGGGTVGGNPDVWSVNDPRWYEVSPQNPAAVQLHRLYSDFLGVHTVASGAESIILLQQRRIDPNNVSVPVWRHEGILGLGYANSGNGSIPLYRFFRAYNNDHYFTTVNSIPPGYTSEGTMAGVFTSGCSQIICTRRPVYVYATINDETDHVYTINFNELGNGNSHWRYDGIAFYVDTY